MTRYEVLNVGLLLESPHPKENQSDKQKNERSFSKSLIIKKKTSADTLEKHTDKQEFTKYVFAEYETR